VVSAQTLIQTGMAGSDSILAYPALYLRLLFHEILSSRWPCQSERHSSLLQKMSDLDERLHRHTLGGYRITRVRPNEQPRATRAHQPLRGEDSTLVLEDLRLHSFNKFRWLVGNEAAWLLSFPDGPPLVVAQASRAGAMLRKG
jgi:hypothetical protein